MHKQCEPVFAFDVTSAMSRGARDYQEDAMLANIANGADLGFVILADGMGGHAAGDVASQIVLTEVFRALTFMRSEMVADRTCIPETLRDAARAANSRLRSHVEMHSECSGMGSTLLVAVLIGDELHWISIGDSPLFLFRENELTQLNEDHSMSRAIDTMVAAGAMSAAEGKDHPDRNVLTSVLYGKPIPHVDCPEMPLKLKGGDTLIVASDGLQFLPNVEIEAVLRDQPLSGSAEISDSLMEGLERLQDPDLDNVSLSVVQVKTARAGSGVRPVVPLRVIETGSIPDFVQPMFSIGPRTKGAAG